MEQSYRRQDFPGSLSYLYLPFIEMDVMIIA